MHARRTGIVSLALVAIGLTGPSLARLPGYSARASNYSVQEDPTAPSKSAKFTLEGTITDVDVARDRVTFTTDDGQSYTLDTYRSAIVLPNTERVGETADLSSGMRIRVDATRLALDILQADRVRVLTASADAAPRDPVPPGDIPDHPDTIDLRGTVQTVDQRHASFVVRINQHTRTVFVDDGTKLPEAEQDTTEPVPFRPGDRVTVTGSLRPDGTVAADAVSLGRPTDAYRRLSSDQRELEGRLTQESSRFYSRDIKIRLDANREVKIHVPSGTLITRDGRPISVHDLTTDDVVRISGTPDGDDFRADRIVVVHTYGDED